MRTCGAENSHLPRKDRSPWGNETIRLPCTSGTRPGHGGGALVLLLLASALLASPARADVVAQFPNPCPEGEYLDQLSACAPLIRPAGGFRRADFLSDFAPFAANVLTLDQCDETELQEALASVAQAGGGIVSIPACTISVSDDIPIPSNAILRGSGPETRLVAVPGFAQHMLNVESSKNVVVQDLSLIGAANLGKGIVIRRSRNVLVERVILHAFGHSNLTFRQSQRVTLRYLQSTNAKTFHGIESKDCSPVDPDIPDEVECANAALPVGFGAPLTSDYSIHSNYIAGNGDHGLDIHASNGEVCGNSSVGNGFAAKFPDAMSVLIHHNRFESTSGIKFYNTYEIGNRWVRNIVLYRNEFSIWEGDYTLRNDAGTEGIYLLDNHYEPQDLRRAVNPADALYTCPETEDVDLVDYAFFPSQDAPDELCNATALPEPSTATLLTCALPLLYLLKRSRASKAGSSGRVLA